MKHNNRYTKLICLVEMKRKTNEAKKGGKDIHKF